MGISHSNTKVLNQYDDLEVVLPIESFYGGENTIAEDQAAKTHDARTCENWEAISLGGMRRAAGFNEVASGGVTYTDAPDLLVNHKDSGGSATYGIIEGDLVIKSGSSLNNEDNGAFTSGVLSHAVSAGSKLWITNQSDNLKVKEVGVVIATPSGVPTTACSRIYNHKNRLIAEGSVSVANRVYGSRTGIGNWSSADTWSLSNDAWSIDLPEDTQGCVPDFPSGNEVMVFTKDKAYALSNFPNTAFRPLGATSRGCSAPLSVARGDEGVYFLSERPTLGIFLFDGTNYTELTEFNKDVFVDLIDLSKRVYGIYRNKKYYLFYNELNSGVSYPNRLRIFDARFGRWMKRPINASVSDNFGYPALLKYSNNELYVASSRQDKLYELETEDDSDELQNTEATYTTKTFSSRDFAIAHGGQFPIDDVKLKLTKITMTYFGTTGAIGVQWSSDRGLHSGSKTFSLTANGDLLNTTFIVNTSLVTATPPDKTVTFSFPNDAVGKRFQFTITNSGSSTRPEVKRIKVHAITVDES